MLCIRTTPAFLVLILVSCGKSPSGGAGGAPAEQDSQTPREELRLAALSPAMAVMIRDLGYEDQIVAKHDYDMVLSDRVPAAGSELGFDLEVLIEADPTHLFFQKTTTERSAKLIEIAEEQGWVIFERRLETLDDIAITMDDLYYFFDGEPQIQLNKFGVMEVSQHTPPSEGLAASWDDLGPVADAAGRVLVLGSVDPIGAMGVGSYHHQLLERLGATPAIDQGGKWGAMWVELDYEDLIALNPDSIILILPREPSEADRFGERSEPTLEDAMGMLGAIGALPISAVEDGRVGLIDHPLGLLPSGALGEVADEMGELMRLWVGKSEP